jgi:hypothetical protein
MNGKKEQNHPSIYHSHHHRNCREQNSISQHTTATDTQIFADDLFSKHILVPYPQYDPNLADLHGTSAYFPLAVLKPFTKSVASCPSKKNKVSCIIAIVPSQDKKYGPYIKPDLAGMRRK